MVRPLAKHIDNEELNALVPSSSENGRDLQGLSADAVRDAERHVAACGDCGRKVSEYRRFVELTSNRVVSAAAPEAANCPKDIDWPEVAAGLWPELKARQLIMHAAVCDHCGPLLRAATSSTEDATAEEEEFLAGLKPPTRPRFTGRRVLNAPPRRRYMNWLVPALALLAIVIALSAILPSSRPRLSGPKFAEFAVDEHRQYAKGNLVLDVRSDSQQQVNDWLKSKLPFSLALPASPAAPGEERPFRLEGARLVRVGSQTAAYIAYHLQTGPAGLLVIPDAVADATGGVQADFKKVSFHYRMIDGFKVVTWSLHGLTYALVSREGNNTQQSCMVCHSAMRDRDLSHTPTPLRADGNATQSILQ